MICIFLAASHVSKAPKKDRPESFVTKPAGVFVK